MNISTGIGENSNDNCCMCGDEWSEGHQGRVLCDSDKCENTVCTKCTSMLSLSVSELFYCPVCAGSGQSAAATAGGALATAVAACTELEKLPQSFKTTQKILTNLLRKPEEQKYRKLRMENKSVKQLVDLEPVLNILTSIGFVRKQCERQQNTKHSVELLPMEDVLLLEGPLPTDHVHELLEILDGLAPVANKTCNYSKHDEGDSPTTTKCHVSMREKRKLLAESDKDIPNKKQKDEEVEEKGSEQK